MLTSYYPFTNPPNLNRIRNHERRTTNNEQRTTNKKMCGISGIIDTNNSIQIDQNTLQNMAKYLNYRGPDQEGFEVDTSDGFTFGLAHKRLSILDVSEASKQPMWNKANSCVIVFNGEIYNYLEIKKELQQLGHHFHSTGDTEVIINAYQRWGINETLKRLEGMFAFCLVDKKSRKVFLARDRFGEKPLYYHINQKGFIAFGSDIRSFKSLPINLTINQVALGYYFSEMSTPKNASIYNEIKKLSPGSYMEISQKGVKTAPYWVLSYQNKLSLSQEELIQETEVRIEQAVQKMLRSDVPVGCFLSGGIDSSLIALYAAKNYSKKIETFSVGFEYESFNELPYARKVADYIDSNHNEIVLNPKDLNIVDALLEEYGEPFADSSAIPTYYVSKFAGRKVKVALGGDGGDEIFAGYRTYNQGFRMQHWYNRKLLISLLSILSKLTPSQKVKYLHGLLKKDTSTIATALYRNMGFSSNDLKKLYDNIEFYKSPVIEHEQRVEEALKCTDNIFDELLHASINTRLVNDYLVKTDRASMFNSLELRTPFLDKNIIEFTSNIPYHQLMKGGENKYITKKIAEKYFDKAFIYRKKQGFGIPIGEWMKKEWKKEVENVIFQKQQTIPWNEAYVQQLWNEHQSGKVNHVHRLWTIYVFQKWIKNNAI